jgi:hypothetical protein
MEWLKMASKSLAWGGGVVWCMAEEETQAGKAVEH